MAKTVITITHSESQVDAVALLHAETGNRFLAGQKLMRYFRACMSGMRNAKVVVGVNAAHASGTVTLPDNVQNDVLIINGVSLTAKDSPSGESEFATAAQEDACADALVAKINAHSTISPLVSAAKSTAGVSAVGTLDLTADIVLTSVSKSADRNTKTLTLQIIAAAANVTNTVLAVFGGTAAAMTLTITPNDGTNNSATPVGLTTAEIVELINTGAVVGKSVTVTDSSSFRALQTATGGGVTAVADSGEGDGVVATFAGGVSPVVTLTAVEPGLLGNAVTLAETGNSFTVGAARLSGGDSGAASKTHYYGSGT